MDRLDRAVVASTQKLRNREYTRTPVIWDEEERGKNQRRHRSEPIEIRQRDTAVVRLASNADEVRRADVSRNHGHTNRPERERSARDEEISAVFHILAEENADRRYTHHINDNDGVV